MLFILPFIIPRNDFHYLSKCEQNLKLYDKMNATQIVRLKCTTLINEKQEIYTLYKGWKT